MPVLVVCTLVFTVSIVHLQAPSTELKEASTFGLEDAEAIT